MVLDLNLKRVVKRLIGRTVVIRSFLAQKNVCLVDKVHVVLLDSWLGGCDDQIDDTKVLDLPFQIHKCLIVRQVDPYGCQVVKLDFLVLQTQVHQAKLFQLFQGQFIHENLFS